MKREATTFLQQWLASKSRKPLVIRGARQVGKTWLVRHFAELIGLELIEINFEKRPELASNFDSNDPEEILILLSTVMRKKLDPERILLFLDEIQSAPEILGKLRWFSEDMPKLPVIAAGSLLEFVLGDHDFSMPVGRINYMHLEPLSFDEFLVASGEEMLGEYLKSYQLMKKIPIALHTQAMKAVKEYMIIGGMPLAVSTWIDSRDLNKVSQVQFDLLATYRDDFTKYSGRLPIERLEEVLLAVPRQLGNKFVFTKVNSAVSSTTIKQALHLLAKARICHQVISSSANGVPLGAEKNEKHFKTIFLDCGLCSASLGLRLDKLTAVDEITMVNSGGIAEQVVGQLLRTLFPFYVEPNLYYWQREEKTGNAEVDYVIQHENYVVPVEVKAGSTGKLRSLHQFAKEKVCLIAVRVNSDFPSYGPVKVKDSSGSLIEYTLLSLPFYLMSQLHRLLTSCSI